MFIDWFIICLESFSSSSGCIHETQDNVNPCLFSFQLWFYIIVVVNDFMSPLWPKASYTTFPRNTWVYLPGVWECCQTPGEISPWCSGTLQWSFQICFITPLQGCRCYAYQFFKIQNILISVFNFAIDYIFFLFQWGLCWINANKGWIYNLCVFHAQWFLLAIDFCKNIWDFLYNQVSSKTSCWKNS